MVHRFTQKIHHTQKLKLKLNWSNLAMLLFSLLAVFSVQMPGDFQDDLPASSPVVLSRHVNVGEFQLCTRVPPDSDMARIQIDMDNTDAARLNIINIQGQTVLSQQIKKSCEISLDLQQLASGQYFVQLVSRQGTKTDRLLVK